LELVIFSINVFDFSLEAVNGLCIYGKGPLTGIAYYNAPTHTLRAMAPFGTDLFYLIGTKP
jgi:hypothetical protein